jgi:UDP-3-O-[3-hydroxymyristoyl] glucosamine N-acyltransferase
MAIIMELHSFEVHDIVKSLENEGISVEMSGPSDMVVTHLKNIDLADDHSLTFYIGHDSAILDHLNHCALFCLPGVVPKSVMVTCLFTDDPKLAFYIAAQLFIPKPQSPGVHPTAIIHPLAQVHPTAFIGPYCLIDKCVIGEGTFIQSHVRIGDDSRIENRVNIETGSYIGATGQVWAWGKDGRKWIMPQFGGVIVEDDCFIGSNVTIVRGALQNTVIGRGCRIAHGSMIGHNCFFGEETFISNGVAVAGSVTTGRNCFLGSGSRYRPGVTIGNNITVGVGAVVISDFRDDDLVLAGVPAKIIKKGNPGIKLAGVPKKPSYK